jgi:hypothetical protein
MTRATVLLVMGVAFAAAPSPLAAQASTDILLAELSVSAGVVRIGAPVNVTARPGYDNQPYFTPDGAAFLYTSIGAGGQADVFRFDLRTRTAEQLTRTVESEYSPTPLEGGGFAVVRVEQDSTQRLWRFPDGGGEPTLLLEGIAPVGYFAWADASRVVMFVLGSPPRLVLADVGSGTVRTVAEDIGRTIRRIPGRAAVSFVQRIEGGRSFVVELDARTGKLRTLTEARPGADYHAWTPGGILLMSDGSRLLQWNPAVDRSWRQVADLTGRGVAISRIAVSPAGDQIVFVAHPLGTGDY